MKILTMMFQKVFLATILLPIFSVALHGQNKEPAIRNMVESGEFTFHAQMAMPLSGGSRQLTPDYELGVSKNAIVSYLPFFGRAYSLPYGGSEGGFNFTSKDFEYKFSARKKGWQINIRPRDVADLREFSLTVSKNGYGTLQVLSNNRQPMSFTGYIASLK